jgi:hypothetical protein
MTTSYPALRMGLVDKTPHKSFRPVRFRAHSEPQLKFANISSLHLSDDN